MLMASVVVVSEEVVKGGREWRGWIGMRLDRIPVLSGGGVGVVLDGFYRVASNKNQWVASRA